MKTWDAVALCASGIAALALGYAVYFDYKRRNDVTFRKRLLEERRKELKLRKKQEKKMEKEQKKIQQVEIPQDDTDLPIEEILRKPGEERQKIFYQMLIKGEEILKLGTEYTDKAIHYFYKAMKMVPSPTELLVAFQKTLPNNVFMKLLETIQMEDQKRIFAYFDGLAPSDAPIGFQKVETTNATGTPATVWRPVAKEDISAGQTIYTDSPVLSTVAPSLLHHMTMYCEHCQASLEGKDSHPCEKCSYSVTCSESCLQSASKYHVHLCPKDKEAGEENAQSPADHPYVRLLSLCKSQNSTLGLLMAKYLALLLSEELKSLQDHGSTQGPNPFYHFEFLKSVKVESDEFDAREVLLMRLLFGTQNGGMLEFLSLERYLSMKNTMRFNAIGFAVGALPPQTKASEAAQESEPSSSLTEGEKAENAFDTNSDTDTVFIEPKVEETASAAGNVPKQAFSGRHSYADDCAGGLGLFHVGSHISHSCDANAEFVAPSDSHTLALTATRAIKKGDEITVPFIPVKGKSALERQALLHKQYQIICRCDICEAEVVAK